MLTTGHQDTRQNCMGNSAVFDTVAAIGFAGDHGWPQHAFGLIIGCLQPIHVQETQ